VRAKNLLERKGIPYTEIDLDGKEEELNALRAQTGWRTVPQIFIGDEMIGGFTDLADLEARGELDRMLKD
jgi:glutaredoxin 3